MEQTCFLAPHTSHHKGLSLNKTSTADDALSLSLQTDNPNSFHCYQTAERIREVHPDKEWFQLTGLIHDLGKVLAVWGEPQYAVVGDTFPVGCAFSPKCVFPEMFEGNPDSKDSRYK